MQLQASVRDIFEKFVLRIKPGGTLIVCGDGYVFDFRLGPVYEIAF